MKTFYLTLLLALAAQLGYAQCNQLVWADEFTTDGDLSKWRVYEGDGCETGLCNFGNNELQVYRAANNTVSGGYLNIATRAQNLAQGSRNYNYTSGKVFSKTAANALQTFRFGRIEASIKLPSAQGIWPAFWMLADPNRWPGTGEIDIMEAKHRNPRSVAGTIHYDANGWHYTGRSSSGTIDLSAGFHTYAIEWSPNQIQWFVDSQLYHTATPQTTTGHAWPFNTNNYYIMLNAAVGGPGTAFTNNTNPIAGDFPVTMQVDYVRVYGGTYNYSIGGPALVLANDQNTSYRLDPIAGATYTWAVPAGASVASGQGTNAVLINWGSGGGNIAVTVSVPGCPDAAYHLFVDVAGPAPIGPNLALLKPAFSSSQESATYAAAQAVDGSAGTRWASTFSNNEWLYVDLQGVYDLSQVVLRWEAAYGRRYQIETSMDALTWTPRYSTSTGNGGLDNIPLTGTGRYVRLLGQQRATAYGYSLYELEVYGTANALGTRAAAADAAQIHPNPTTGPLHVETSGRATTLQLTDAQGRLLQQQQVAAGQAATTLALDGLPAGVYLLKLRTATGVSVQKVVKQ